MKQHDEKFCTDCGKLIKARAEICPFCGIRQMPAVSRTNNIDQNKSKLVAAMLAIFLGAIGIHKFYLGKSGKGIMYLLFFWTFIPAIVGFFEGIGLLMQNQQSFDAEYNQ